MPIKPLILQRRHAELGRIRLGYKAQISGGRTRPAKLESFRFTSTSEGHIRDLASLYGGAPAPWDNNGIRSWEVYTDATSVPVYVVKGGMSQWMEAWAGGGVSRRCDGDREIVSDSPCVCYAEDGERLCKPTTRLSVILPELEAVGVWRLETHGWNAAAELPTVAELAQLVGDMVKARLHLVERRSVRDGKTSRFVVPVLDLEVGIDQLRGIAEAMSTGGGVIAAPVTGVAELAPPDTSPPTAGQIKRAGLDQLRDMWRFCEAKGYLDINCTGDLIMARVQELRDHGGGDDTGGVVDAEIVYDTSPRPPEPDPDVVWQQILSETGALSWSLEETIADCASSNGGVSPETMSGTELAAYLTNLRSRINK